MLETPTQVFSRKYWEIIKNTYFEEHLRMASFSPLNHSPCTLQKNVRDQISQ